jgi:cephalosporin hydroxylase
VVDIATSVEVLAQRGQRQVINGVKVDKLAADLDRYSRIIAATRPDVVVECGTRYGGSALWFAGQGVDVITIDLIQKTSPPAHPAITYLVGDSVHRGLAAQVAATVHGRRVMVSLDSDHSADHVTDEIDLYGPLVTPGCYLVVEDTILGHADQQALAAVNLAGLPGSPLDAVRSRLVDNPAWVRDEEIEHLHSVSHHPMGWWRRA